MNYYKIENNYPMTYSGDKPLDESWKEFTVTDGVYEPTELQEALDAEQVANELSTKIAEAKAYLASTDFKVLPDYDKEPSEVIAKRAEAREFIRANQGVIDGL